MASQKAASTIIRRIISTPKAPAAVGPYSQAVRIGETIYLSGQIAMSPETGEMVPGGVEVEAEQVLKNMGEILKAAGVTYNNVVKTTVLLADIADFQRVNQVYSKYFSTHKPARAAYQVAALPKGAKVEIEAVAVFGDIVDE